MQKLFSQNVLFELPITVLLDYFSEPQNLVNWNYAVTKMEKVTENEYILHRNYEFGREMESVTIRRPKETRFVYEMTGGRADYVVDFELIALDDTTTQIHEVVSSVNENRLFMLIAPMMKHGFKQNLLVLKKQLEAKTSERF